MSKLEQEQQIKSSRTYTDALAAGAGMEAPGSGDDHAEWDLNNLRSQVKRITDPAGATKWHQDMAAAGFDNFGLKQIHDKPFVFPYPFTPGTNDFTLGAPAAGVVVPSTKVVGATPRLAVGPSSTSDGGYLAASEANFTVAGTLGVGLTTAVDGDALLLNQVDIRVAGTNDPVLDAGATVFGLFQALTGTADNALIAAAASENAQISFVKINPATDAIVSVSLPVGSYHFGLPRQRYFYSLTRGAFGRGSSGEVIDPGAVIPITGYRVFKITGPGPGILGPAADDPMHVQTGTFTTGGAQTTLATNGTPILQATGALFKNDPRTSILRNGVEQAKESSVGGDLATDCYWISATQIAFRTALRIGEYIHVRSPQAF